MYTVNIPDNFARTMAEIYGEAGLAWLARLPSLVGAYARQWSLTVLPPFEPLSYNYVAPAMRADGTDVVLKVGFPNPELYTEIEALRCFEGHGSVQLLEVSRKHGVLLLERLKPGTPLSKERDDRRATSVAVAVMQQLWRPAPDTQAFPSVAQWAQGLRRLRDRFAGGTGPFPAPLVDAAERLFTELLTSMAAPVLLHGDLHHGNILAAQRQPWLALDPKGVLGEPAYEVGALLRNLWPGLLAEPHPGQVLAQRVDQFADALGVERARIVGWGRAQAVLSAWWSLEDHGYGWEWGIACAELLAQLR
jgi:streptomycin 6-kinase